MKSYKKTTQVTTRGFEFQMIEDVHYEMNALFHCYGICDQVTRICLLVYK